MLIFWLFARKNNTCCNMYQNVPTLLYNNKLILKKLKKYKHDEQMS